MVSTRWLIISATLAVLATGCGKSSTNESSQSGGATSAVAQNGAKSDSPVATVNEFLEALRTGNDEKASQLLTAAAREKTASLNRNITPSASDTAKFAIGKVDYVNDDGARVACTWTDVDDAGQPQTDEAVWVLRREQQGWRILGVAAQMFPGEQPLMLNFEDPEDMQRKKQWVREEMRRRSESGGLQAQKDSEKTEKSIRR
jgi:hypothetical protein